MKEKRGTATPFTLCKNLLVPTGIQLLEHLVGSTTGTSLTWRPKSCLQASHFPQWGGTVTPSWVSSPRHPSGNHTRCLWPTEKQETITGGVAHSLFSSTILSQGERNKSLQWGCIHPSSQVQVTTLFPTTSHSRSSKWQAAWRMDEQASS